MIYILSCMKNSARLVKFQSIVEIGTLHITASASKISQWQNGKHKPLIIVVTLWSEQFNVRVAGHWFVNSRPSCCIECLIHTSTHCTFMFQFSNAYFFTNWYLLKYYLTLKETSEISQICNISAFLESQHSASTVLTKKRWHKWAITSCYRKTSMGRC